MTRQRVTVTIRKEILKKLDQLVDGSQIRNRSHAIETLLERLLFPRVERALILAGGKGVKMRPLTYEIPKPMIPIRGRPIMEYMIDLLKQAGVREIVLAIGYLGGKIREYFGDGERWGVKIFYSEEEKALGTAGAIRLARPFLNSRSFLVVHGDILAEIELNDFIAFHQEQKVVASLALTSSGDPLSYGVVQLHGSRVVDFVDRPGKGKKPFSHLINAGIYLFEPEIFRFIPPKGKAMLEDIFPRLAKEGKLAGFVFEGKWFDVSTPTAYDQAIKEWG